MSKPKGKSSGDVVVVWEQVGGTMTKLGEVHATLIDEVRDIVADHTRRVSGNAEPVVVLDVDEAELRRWQPPRGLAKDITVEHVYPSAAEASFALGYKYNEAALKLGRVRKQMEQDVRDRSGPKHNVRICPVVTIRGVKLQYKKDFSPSEK